MSLTLTPETKNTLSLTNQNKDFGITWDEATFTWDEGVGSWDVPNRINMVKESKNTLTLTNETKT